jgi:hypothetical protein
MQLTLYAIPVPSVNESTQTSDGFENYFVPGEEVPFWSSQPLIVALIALCELGPADSEC